MGGVVAVDACHCFLSSPCCPVRAHLYRAPVRCVAACAQELPLSTEQQSCLDTDQAVPRLPFGKKPRRQEQGRTTAAALAGS